MKRCNFSKRSQKVFYEITKMQNRSYVAILEWERFSVAPAIFNHMMTTNFERTQRADDDVDDCFVDNV